MQKRSKINLLSHLLLTVAILYFFTFQYLPPKTYFGRISSRFFPKKA